jgi:hypothetical protein
LRWPLGLETFFPSLKLPPGDPGALFAVSIRDISLLNKFNSCSNSMSAQNHAVCVLVCHFSNPFFRPSRPLRLIFRRIFRQSLTVVVLYSHRTGRSVQLRLMAIVRKPRSRCVRDFKMIVPSKMADKIVSVLLGQTTESARRQDRKARSGTR